ncbi:hypothetical protein BKA58DRAFT_406569 [Alternaria rosae]|uniref:uncharacterized protein n=1 Tax=Alternaria rosae TaxID=1187941 RepID=UPI001E8E69D4|nr:uncharacterized protein BKA58DRAFT_406569 [Alternaria rosae]KAH6851496.1 hypothetical protein BKA58DRAFT_406569 [Alternaria rosae]
MSPEQTAEYIARFRNRIATIRQNVTVTSLKGRITHSIHRRDSLGRRGENARLALSASLGLYYTGVEKSEEDLRDLSPVDWDDGDNNDGDDDDEGDEGDVDCDGRSDSMEPLRDSDREDITNGYWDGQWDLDMDREEERLRDAEHRIAEERSSNGNGDVEGGQYVAYHSMNSRAARRMRLDEVERMYRSGGRYSTVGKKKGRELQSLLQNLRPEEWNDEAPIEDPPQSAAQDEENEYEELPQPTTQEDQEQDSISLPSNPYPEDDFLLPLTRQPARTTPPPPLSSPANFIINPNSSTELSVPSNPYPEDAPSPTPSFQPPPPPSRPTQSPSPFHRAATPPTPHSRFAIYLCDRTISPIAPFTASRHLISAAGSKSTQSYQSEPLQQQGHGYNDNDDVEEEYAPNHPYHGMSAQETSEYWYGLEGYQTESERNLRRRGEGRGRRRAVSSPVQYNADRAFGSVGENHQGDEGEGGEREDEVRRRYLDGLSDEARVRAEEEKEEEFAMRTGAEETNAKRKDMMGRLLSTFACRPGTVTPTCTAVPIPNDTDATTTPTVSKTPRKYGMTYLSHKIGRTQKREEEARLRERLMAIQLHASAETRTQHIEDINTPTEVPVLIPKAKRRKDSTQPNPPSLVPNLESRTQSIIGPPVDLSQMIQRAPESIRAPTPVPKANTDVEGVEEDGKHGPRQKHSGSSLSDRLRQTQLEDLPLQSDAAQEIRNLMMALERDQGEAASTPTQHSDIAPHDPNPNTTSLQQADELPGGFSISSQHSSLSPHETLERHFRTQRQVNERYTRRIRPTTSHSSSLTLPEGHGGVRGVLRITNMVIQGEGEEEENIGGFGEEDEGCERDEGCEEVGAEVGVDDSNNDGANSVIENQQASIDEVETDAEEKKGSLCSKTIRTRRARMMYQRPDEQCDTQIML